jgi:hypothetical protein
MYERSGTQGAYAPRSGFCPLALIDDVAKLFHSGRLHVLPDNSIQLWEGLDTLKHLAQTRHELPSKARSDLLQIIVNSFDVRLSGRADDDGQAHDFPSNWASTSRQGLPTPG